MTGIIGYNDLLGSQHFHFASVLEAKAALTVLNQFDNQLCFGN